MFSRLFMGNAQRSQRSVRERAASLLRRLVHFLVVWSALLLVHEYGHAWTASSQGYSVDEIIVGAGPVLWRGTVGDTELSFRLVPLVGITRLGSNERVAPTRSLIGDGMVYAAGILATMVFALFVAGLSAIWEGAFRNRCVWGRMIVADAVVLSVLNCLPVPPLDGGRAMFAALTALRGSPLSSDAMLWMQLGGLALAIVPMAIWTRWTMRIDAVAMWWRVPASSRPAR